MTTIAYANSKAVHSALKRLLGPWFVANGWKKRPGSSCAFIRPAASGYWCLWVQISQWGDSLSGNSFTLNLVPQTAADSAMCGGPGARVLATLGEDDRLLGFDISRQIAASTPVPPPSHQVYEWAQFPGKDGEYWRHRIANLQKDNPHAWKPDVAECWLNYYSVADIDRWAEFLIPRLSYLLRQSEAE